MTFSPARSAISNITRSNPCVVTTSTNHNLNTGGVVRLHVPKNYGMEQLNNLACAITVLSSLSFSLQYTQVPPAINVDSSNYTAFTVPSNPQFTAEVIPIGSGPTPVTGPQPLVTNNVCESTIEDQVLNISTTEIPF